MALVCVYDGVKHHHQTQVGGPYTDTVLLWTCVWYNNLHRRVIIAPHAESSHEMIGSNTTFKRGFH